MADLTRKELQAFAEAEARRQGLPSQLVQAVIDVETGGTWNPRARSPKNASGLMQLIPSTARDMGVTDAEDPIQNIRGGVKYLKQQINRFGDIGLALSAYNWGPTRAAQLEENPRGMRPPDETLKYVPEVFARMRKYGQMLAPSAFTIAIFPLMKRVLSDEALTTVRDKLGLGSKDDVTSAIQTGNVRGPVPANAAPGPLGAAEQPQFAPAPPSPNEAEVAAGLQAQEGLGPEAGGGETGGAGAIEGEVMPPAGPALPVPARRGPPPPAEYDAYLRREFGPLAEIADPFPTTYDSQLQQMIDRA